jgi:hypothetical protein
MLSSASYYLSKEAHLSLYTNENWYTEYDCESNYTDNDVNSVDSDVDNDVLNQSDEFSGNTQLIPIRKIKKALYKKESYKPEQFSRTRKSKSFGKPNKMIYANSRYFKHNRDSFDMSLLSDSYCEKISDTEFIMHPTSNSHHIITSTELVQMISGKISPKRC